MSNFNNIFNFHSIERLRELLQEDSDKKFEDRKNKNKQSTNFDTNTLETNQNTMQSNENLINI